MEFRLIRYARFSSTPPHLARPRRPVLSPNRNHLRRSFSLSHGTGYRLHACVRDNAANTRFDYRPRRRRRQRRADLKIKGATWHRLAPYTESSGFPISQGHARQTGSNFTNASFLIKSYRWISSSDIYAQRSARYRVNKRLIIDLVKLRLSGIWIYIVLICDWETKVNGIINERSMNISHFSTTSNDRR